MLTNEQGAALESLIDTQTLRVILEALADICGAKADHVRSTWQDGATASVWAQAARRINKTAQQTSI